MGCPEHFNFAQHIIELNAPHPDKAAYIDDQGTLSYGDLEQQLKQFAAGLGQLQIRREERVLLVMQDRIEWPISFLGCLYAGIIPVAVNTLLPAADYAYMLEHSRAQAIITCAELLPVLREALAQAEHEVRHIIVAGESTSHDTLAWKALLQGQDGAQTSCHTLADEAAFWLYSSGSTGRPKGVVHSHANLWYTAELYGKPILGVQADDIVFSAAKLFFAYGLGNALTFPLSVGACTLLMAGRPTPEAIFQRLIDFQPTVFCGVPTLYASMLANPDKPNAAQLSIRICASAGESLPRDIGERFRQQFGADILDGLGSTEMLHIFLSNQVDDIRYGSTGKAVPGYEVQLRNESGQAVEQGEIGDLYIRGPSAAMLYWNNRSKSKETFLGDWLRSGDKYTCDADGYYTYAGRSDDMIKVSGQYVSPIEIENILIQHEAVMEAAVIGVEDDYGLTKTQAYIVLRPGQPSNSDMALVLQNYVKSQLAPFKYPRHICFITDLPKTATGKIQRFRLRQLHEEQRAS